MNDYKPNSPFRLANFEDVTFITRLIKEFYRKRQACYAIAYDHESTLIMVDDTIRHGVCIVGPTSCAGAMLSPFPSNCGAIVAHAVFWYFKHPREIRVFDELARACREVGATHMSASSHFPDNTIGRYYEGLGLVKCETQYLGSLETCCKPISKAVRANQ